MATDLGRVLFVGKELVLASFKNGKVQGARVHFFPPQLSKFPRFGGSERENRVALIHEQVPFFANALTLKNIDMQTNISTL